MDEALPLRTLDRQRSVPSREDRGSASSPKKEEGKTLCACSYLGGRRDSASAVDTPRAPQVSAPEENPPTDQPRPCLPHHNEIVTDPREKKKRNDIGQEEQGGATLAPQQDEGEDEWRETAASEGGSNNAERPQDRAKRERRGCLRGKSRVGGLLACCISAEMQRTRRPATWIAENVIE